MAILKLTPSCQDYLWGGSRLRTDFGHGYSGHAAAYPFESVYSSEKRLLMQSLQNLCNCRLARNFVLYISQ